MICESRKARFERLTAIIQINMAESFEVTESLLAVKSAMSPSEWERYCLTRLGTPVETIEEYLEVMTTLMEGRT